jgi:hydroxymethylbilane synthase
VTPRELRLGTRGSQLALWQANTVAAQIAAHGGRPCRIVTVRTSGDRLQDAPLSEAGGKRLFVKEIEDALLRGDIDLAVHSSKDMPAVLPEGLTIAAVLPREDPCDAVVLPAGAPPLADVTDLAARLGAATRIGTASVRRVAQLLPLLPGAGFVPMRGNLDTRLRKLDEGSYDALILAAAGLRRLGFAGRISFTLPPDACVPAPGQGIVAIETRAADQPTCELVARINDETAAAALVAERSVVEALGGGCQTPIGALASMTAAPGELRMVAIVSSLDGRRQARASGEVALTAAAALGRRLADDLIARGAAEILSEAATQTGQH